MRSHGVKSEAVLDALRWINDGPWYPHGPLKSHPGAGAFYAAENAGLAAHDPIWRLTEAGAEALGVAPRPPEPTMPRAFPGVF